MISNVRSAIVAITTALMVGSVQANTHASAEASHRPQEERIAAASRPYREERVAFDNSMVSGVRLAGTLTLPAGTGPFPGVVYIAGSGPNARDEELGGHKLALVVADTLTRSGCAVLRYDKRGVSESSGNYDDATTMDSASDAAAAVAYLRSRPEIAKDKVGLVGHSEGGTIAALLASKDSSLAFVVMMAGFSIPGKELVAEQDRRIAIVNGVQEEDAAVAYRLKRRLFDAIAASKDQHDAEARVKSILAAAKPQPTKELAEEAILYAELPSMRFVLAFDPARSFSGTWAQRLKRVFLIDVTVCEHCGGAVKIIACIEDKATVRKILAHVESATSPPGRLPPARGPPGGSADLFG